MAWLGEQVPALFRAYGWRAALVVLVVAAAVVLLALWFFPALAGLVSR